MNRIKMSSQVYDDGLQLLLSQLVDNSESAFQLLFKRYQDKVYKVALLYTKDVYQAEEIVQDVFLKIWLNRNNLLNVISFESWLFIMTKNHTLNVLKKQASEKITKEKWGAQAINCEDSVESEYILSEYQRILTEAINHLPLQQQLVYKMAKEQGLTYESIGIQLSLSPLTVKTHMARALSALRSFAKRHIDVLLLAAFLFLKNI